MPKNVFEVKFMVVPDSTTTYSILLGREFMTRPGLTVILNKTIDICYDPHVNEILNIEVVEIKEKLDIIAENLDSSLPVDAKQALENPLNNYGNSKRESDPNDYKFHIQLTEKSKPFYSSPRRLSRQENRDKLRGTAIGNNRRLQEYNKDVFVKKHKKLRAYKIGDLYNTVLKLYTNLI